MWKKINILFIYQFLCEFCDGMVLQGLKWRALIGLGTKSGKNKM